MDLDSDSPRVSYPMHLDPNSPPPSPTSPPPRPPSFKRRCQCLRTYNSSELDLKPICLVPHGGKLVQITLEEDDYVPDISKCNTFDQLMKYFYYHLAQKERHSGKDLETNKDLFDGVYPWSPKEKKLRKIAKKLGQPIPPRDSNDYSSFLQRIEATYRNSFRAKKALLKGDSSSGPTPQQIHSHGNDKDLLPKPCVTLGEVEIENEWALN